LLAEWESSEAKRFRLSFREADFSVPTRVTGMEVKWYAWQVTHSASIRAAALRVDGIRTRDLCRDSIGSTS